MPKVEALTRPIIGIENRTAQEAFDIMCDRIRAALSSAAVAGGEEVGAVAWRFQREGEGFSTDGTERFDTPPTKELEALRRDRDESSRAWRKYGDDMHQRAMAAEARVAELDKALEPFACAIEPDNSTLSGWKFGIKPKHEHFVAARRVREGGKADV